MKHAASKMRFRTPLICCLFFGGLVLSVLSCGRPASTEAAQQEPTTQQMDVRDFVRNTYIEGVPYEDASKYGADAVPTLLGMLQDEEESDYWANIAVTLSIIGDESAVEPLINFIEKDSTAQLSASRARSKESALMGLGYLVNKTGNQRALDYLVQSAKPETWQQRSIEWQSELQPSVEARNVNLSTMAILGLALSGREEAKQALEGIQTETFSEFQPAIGDIVQEALNTNTQVASEGLAEYYRKSREGFGN